jgi:hypothetical protein
MIFTPDCRPKIILPATFSLSNPGDPVFNNTLLNRHRSKRYYGGYSKSTTHQNQPRAPCPSEKMDGET